MQIIAENGCYLTAELGGGIDSRVPGPPAVTARGKPGETVDGQPTDGPWQQWQEIANGDGTVSFACSGGQYLTAEMGGGSTLSTDRTEKGPWQRFRKVGGMLQCYDAVHYLRLRTDLGPVAVVDATGTTRGLTFCVGGPGLSPRPDGQLPAPPSRARLVDYRTHFQGLFYDTVQFGRMPAGWLDLLTAADREAAFATHRAAVGPWHPDGDTHLILNVSSAYTESNIFGWPQALLQGYDYTNDLPRFKAMVRSYVAAGFLVDVRLAGDGLSVNEDPQFGQYNDPVGHTYGYQWMMRNLRRILTALRGDAGSACPDGEDLARYCVFCPGYDGVFYGWSRQGESPDPQPGRVEALGSLFRSILPDGVLAIEHGMGTIPVGGGPADYGPGGKMRDYDIVMGEFPNGLARTADRDPNTNPGCQTWMVVDRMVRQWRRPADMPTVPAEKWDMNPPYYLSQDTPRGPRTYVAFEFSKYLETHGGGFTAEQTEACRAYLGAMGCTHIG